MEPGCAVAAVRVFSWHPSVAAPCMAIYSLTESLGLGKTSKIIKSNPRWVACPARAPVAGAWSLGRSGAGFSSAASC